MNCPHCGMPEDICGSRVFYTFGIKQIEQSPACIEIARLKAKVHLMGGVCGAVRDPNDILRDIAKMAGEELK